MNDQAVSETELARIQWRCRRGLLELDLILQAFLERHYFTLSDAEKSSLTRLLELPDNTLLDYFNGKAEHPDTNLKQLIRKIL